MTPENLLVTLLNELQKYQRFVVAAHDSPDGDAVGSCAAMGWILQALGKEVILFNQSGVPQSLNWLPLPAPVLTRLDALPALPDAVIALDCGDKARLGDEVQPLLAQVPLFNIDHHRGNPEYGTAFNWVDPNRSAVGEMLACLAKEAGLALQGPIAQALYVSISTDTGSFSYDNTTADSLELTAEMLRLGLPLSELRARLSNNWSRSRFYLWGKLMEQTRLLEDGKLAVCLVSQAMLQEFEATNEDLDGFPEQLRRLASVRVTAVIRELPAGSAKKSKASLRSSGKDDVRLAAAQFGGGGHRNAAGVTFDVGPEQALEQLLPYLQQVWNR